MSEKKSRLGKGEVKSSIIGFALGMDRKISESEIRCYLLEKFGVMAQGTINTHLHDLLKVGCLELFPPAKKGFRNHWGITKLKTLEKIIKEFPDLVGSLQNSEHALKIILDALENALSSSTNPKMTKKYKEGSEEIKKHLESVRENLSEKLKLSSSFFKLCIRDEGSLYMNFNELAKISDDGLKSDFFPGYDYKFWVIRTSGIDEAFRACVVMDIIESKGNPREELGKEIEYIKQMKNVVPVEQISLLKRYYEKTLVAPYFIKDMKFVQVSNQELYKLQKDFEKRGGKWGSVAKKL